MNDKLDYIIRTLDRLERHLDRLEDTYHRLSIDLPPRPEFTQPKPSRGRQRGNVVQLFPAD